MDHALRIKSILNQLTSPLYQDSPFSSSRRELEFQGNSDCNGLSFQAFYNRISTFGVHNWGADPNSALYLAKYGFTNVSGCQVRCTSCRITVDLEVFRGKQDILATIATQSHKSNCRWSHLSTPRAYFQIPRNPLKAADDFMMKVQELMTFSYDIPDVQLQVIPEELLAAVKEGNPSDDLDSHVLTSATCIAACGWEKASDSTIHCRFCRRNFGVWTFVSVGNTIKGGSLTRRPSNRIVSLLINHINSEETEDEGISRTQLDDTPPHSEGVYSSESPLGSKSSDKSESSSSDETTTRSSDDGNYMHFRRRLRSRSFFDAQTRKRNALKILRRKACLQQKGHRCKTPTSSGGESGVEDLENTSVKDSEHRNLTGSESDASVITVERNKNGVHLTKNVTSKNHAGVQQNGYPGIRFPEEFLVTKSDSDKIMNLENEVDLPNVNLNVSISNRQLEPVCKVYKSVPVNSESARSYHLCGDDLAKTNSENFFSSSGSNNQSEGDQLRSVHGVTATGNNIPSRDPGNGTYSEQNGDCIVINTTPSLCTTGGGIVFKSTASRDIGGYIHGENYVYFGDSAFQQIMPGNTVPAQESRQNSVLINQSSKLSRDPRINRVNNLPNIVPRQENSHYHSNYHASNQEPVTIVEGEYEESYNDANYHGELYCIDSDENQFTPVICSVVGNAVIPGDAIDNQMEASTSPQKEKELSDGTIVLSSGSACEPEDLKDKCSCGEGGQHPYLALKSRSEFDSDSPSLAQSEPYSHTRSSSETEYCSLADSETAPYLRNCACKNLIYPSCLKSEYYLRNYVEYSFCSKSSYYRHCFRAKYCGCNDSKVTSEVHYRQTYAEFPSTSETEENQGNDSEISVPSSIKYFICGDVTSKSDDSKGNHSEILVSSENENYLGDNSQNPGCWETKYYESNDANKAYFQGRGHSSGGSCVLIDDELIPNKDVQMQKAGEEEDNKSSSKRKRGLSPVHEWNETKKKKVEDVPYEPKSIFDPVLDHRYWCLWKICTGDTSGVSDERRPGWKFHVDAIIEGCTLKTKIVKRQTNDVKRFGEERDRFLKCLDAISDLGRY